MYIYFFLKNNNKIKQVSASKDEFKVKHKEKYCPYHLWTNFSIMSLEDERGRGELNVKGDKGIKITFSTQLSATHSKIFTYYASLYTIYYVMRESCFVCFCVVFDRGELAISQSSLISLAVMKKWCASKAFIWLNIQCSHSTIKEHLALLAVRTW